MVTIKKIEIEDFLGQGDLVWNLDPEVNILGGKNGSGKSTILKFCYGMISYVIKSDLLILEALEKQYKKKFNCFKIYLSNEWIIE